MRNVLRATVDDVAVEVQDRDLAPPGERGRRARLVLVLDVREVAVAGELLGRAIELVVEGEAVDQTGVARLGRDERPGARDLADALLGHVPVERLVAHEHGLLVAQHVDVVGRRDGSGVLVGELLRRALVRADAHELRLHADLVEQPLEVHVLGLEPRVAHASRGIEHDAVGARARVDGLGPCVLPRAEDLLAVRLQHADGVGDLLGVRERARRLGPQDQRDRVDVARLREVPELPQQRDVPARARRALEADPHGVARERDARLRVPGDRRRHVLAGRASEPVAEERPAAGAEPAEVQLESRRAEHAALAVVGQVGDLDARVGAAHHGHVDARACPAAPRGPSPGSTGSRSRARRSGAPPAAAPSPRRSARRGRAAAWERHGRPAAGAWGSAR